MKNERCNTVHVNIVALICLFVSLFVSLLYLPVRLFLVLSPCSSWHVHVLWWNLPRICSCFVFQSFSDFSNVCQHLWYSISIWNGTFFVPGGLFTRKSYNSGLSVYTAITSVKAVFQFVFPDVWDNVPGNRIGKNLLFRFFAGNIGP